MGEAKIRSLHAVEQRAALTAAEQRRSRIKDRFGRGLEIGDGVLLGQTNPHDVVWRIEQMTPAVGPNLPPGAVTVDMVARTRVLFAPGMESSFVTLVLPEPGEPPAKELGEPGPTPPPAPGVTSSGIILSDPDGQSER